jgi:hypothetical protein
MSWDVGCAAVLAECRAKGHGVGHVGDRRVEAGVLGEPHGCDHVGFDSWDRSEAEHRIYDAARDFELERDLPSSERGPVDFLWCAGIKLP